MLRLLRARGVLAVLLWSAPGSGLLERPGDAEKLKKDAYASDRSLDMMRFRGAFNDLNVDIPGLGELPVCGMDGLVVVHVQAIDWLFRNDSLSRLSEKGTGGVLGDGVVSQTSGGVHPAARCCAVILQVGDSGSGGM